MSVGDYVCLGVDACFLAVFYSLYKSNKRNLEAVKNAPVLEIGQALRDEIGGKATKCVSYAVVRGCVKALSRPIISKNVPHVTGVIQEAILREHQIRWSWAARWWTDVTKDVSRSTDTVPFVLMGPYGVVGVEIIEPLQGSGLKLQTIHNVFKPSVTSAWEAITSFFLGERSKGFQEIEKMLPEGTFMTGIGALILGADRQLQLKPPKDGGLTYFFTPMSDEAVVKHLETDTKFFKVLTVILGALGGFIGAKILFGYYRRYKESLEAREEFGRLQDVQLERLMSQRSVREADRMQLNERGGDTGQLCIVCYTNPREVVILECGHICCCVDCSLALNSNVGAACPVCRSPITRLVPAYMP